MTDDPSNCKTAEEAAEGILRHITEEDKQFISKMRKKDLISLHSSLGRSIRNCFGLWLPGSEIIRDFGTRTVNNHPDDVSMYIVERIWEKLQDNSDV